ncbi:MAG: hypothetical protein WAU33_10650 [Candidatus Binataceae bacterium]
MRKITVSALAAGLSVAAAVGAAHAFPVNIGAGSGFQATPGPSMPMQMLNPMPAMPTQQFRNLNVVGDVGMKESELPTGAKIVRLRVDGHDVYMRLDTELSNAELQFDPNASYARDLYRAILTKRIEVVGQQDLRDQIMASADKSQPIKVQGYVFDRTSPFLVVKSVSNQ